jgi:hypothetical protein
MDFAKQQAKTTPINWNKDQVVVKFHKFPENSALREVVRKPLKK